MPSNRFVAHAVPRIGCQRLANLVEGSRCSGVLHGFCQRATHTRIGIAGQVHTNSDAGELVTGPRQSCRRPGQSSPGARLGGCTGQPGCEKLRVTAGVAGDTSGPESAEGMAAEDRQEFSTTFRLWEIAITEAETSQLQAPRTSARHRLFDTSDTLAFELLNACQVATARPR